MCIRDRLIAEPVVDVNMRLLTILEVHDDHIETVFGPIPKWAIRQYVKSNGSGARENSEFDSTKLLVFDRYGVIRGWKRLAASII